MKTSHILITEPSKDYELLDSGEGEKLERFGNVVLSRPDPQALWHKKLADSEWKKAAGYFTRDGSDGRWVVKSNGTNGAEKGKLDRWQIELGGLKLWIKPSAFKHVGVFPEQSVNWEWLKAQIENAIHQPAKGVHVVSDDNHTDSRLHGNDNEKRSETLNILNLFGYTGGATLVCARAGAKVVHVDSSKTAMTQARDNAELSGLKDKPVRWILDDAREFVRREVKRGNRYDGIIMDPPAFGHGTENELWKIEDHFRALVDECFELLVEKSTFFLINGYSAGYSAVAYENILLPLIQRFGGKIEIGELTIREGAIERSNSPTSGGEQRTENGNQKSEIGEQRTGEGRLLPAGIFARWSAN